MTLMSSIEPSKFFFGIDDDAPPRHRQREQEATDEAAFFPNAVSQEALSPMAHAVRFVRIPRETLSALVPNPDDFALHTMNPHLPVTQLLQRYLAPAFQAKGLEDDPPLSGFLNRTVTDLVALALGAGRDAGDIARVRGVRAARLQLVLSGIRSGFDDPQFSAQTLATALGLSSRYVQDLLNETGTTFSERVLELRLQKAHGMLSHPNCYGMKVSDIAFASGFNEVSYFNRCFRRRFGASPTQHRD